MRAVTPLRLLALVLSGALLVGACSSSSDEEADAGAATEDAGSGDEFPVTITHAFGETEITEPPERVVTWGWGSADAAIALGVVPVAIPFQEYGGDEQGVLPWIREALEEQGAELPEILPNSEEAPVEAIAAAEPDLVLAAYSGLTEEEYELLSEVAPVVAYPEEAWSTPWRELVEIVGTALGRSDEAAALLDEIDAELAAQAEAHPELAGKTVAMVWDTGDTFYVYKEADARVEFALALGLEVAPAVRELETDESTFYFTLSHERLGELDSDILVAFADTQEQMDQFLDSAPAQLMSQVREGRVAQMVGTEFIASVSPPTALSVTWGLDDYVAELSAAAQVVDQG
ncbi:MAG: iron-siderophore ABC transporter substrate-binding protein [Acidimicrobiia bacterium]